MKPAIVILGIGGGAGKVLATYADKYTSDSMRLIHVDTDADGIAGHDRIQTILIRNESAHGQGCSGDQNLGENALEFSRNDIQKAIGDCDAVLVVACLGRGTATGGVRVLSRLIKEENLFGLFFVTCPFSFEGRTITDAADNGIKALRQETDIVVAVRNDTLIEPLPDDRKANETFVITNTVLADGVRGLGDLLRCRRGMIPVDIGNMRKLLKRREAFCFIGTATADAATVNPGEFMDTLAASPMLATGKVLTDADAVMAALIGSDDMTIGDMTRCLDELNSRLRKRTRTVIGAHSVKDARHKLQLTVLAITFKCRSGARAAADTADEMDTESPSISQTLPRQPSLPFHEAGYCLGIFSECPATMINNQNLDIPTFQRNEVVLESDEP